MTNQISSTIRQNSVWTMHGRVNRPAHTHCRVPDKEWSFQDGGL
jgi:hypothetical protein